MSATQVPGPLTFQPLFFERVWGGRKLEILYGKAIPADKRIGESWEIVDRAEAQSIVRDGPWRGRSLHDLWVNERRTVFGDVADSPRFPLLVKLLDCDERLSLQVHPPAKVAADLNGEPKTECWYVADAEPGAELYTGWRQPSSPDEFQAALAQETAAQLVHRAAVKAGDTFFIPSGRIHAIGGGILIVEVQQNSDTTFRVFDWNRTDEKGAKRQLHVEEAMRCIDFSDCAPQPVTPDGETLVSDKLFVMERWQLRQQPRELSQLGSFAIALCLTGSVICGTTQLRPGEFALLPAEATQRAVNPVTQPASLLRITIPAP
jgi:mannose-6-phosphate isomerase